MDCLIERNEIQRAENTNSRDLRRRKIRYTNFFAEEEEEERAEVIIPVN